MVTRLYKVMIDAGHGGSQPGNVNWGLAEKETTLQLAARIGHYVRKFSYNERIQGPQVKTLFTRYDDRHVNIDARAKMAVANACDLMLSIHTNSSLNILANGTETFYADVQSNRLSSEELGAEIVGKLAGCGLRNRGVTPDTKTAVKSLGVLRGCVSRMPAVLVEVGFASHYGDRQKLLDKSGRENIAAAIALAVVRHFGLEVAL